MVEAGSRARKSVIQCSTLADAQPMQLFLWFKLTEKTALESDDDQASEFLRVELWLVKPVPPSVVAAGFAIRDEDRETSGQLSVLNCLSYSRNSFRHKLSLSMILQSSSNLLLHSDVYFCTIVGGGCICADRCRIEADYTVAKTGRLLQV